MAREIKDLLLPRGCAGCDAPDEVLCDTCAATFEQGIIRSHAHTGSTYPSFACSEYRGESRRAILRWKDHGDEELTTPFCRLISKRVRRDDSMGLLRAYVGSRPPILVVPAPSTMQSMRHAGHSRSIAIGCRRRKQGGATVTRDTALAKTARPVTCQTTTVLWYARNSGG